MDENPTVIEQAVGEKPTVIEQEVDENSTVIPDFNLIQEYDKLIADIEVPEFISREAPDWSPGKMMPDSVNFLLWKNEEFHVKFLDWIKKDFKSVFAFLEEHFDHTNILQVRVK